MIKTGLYVALSGVLGACLVTPASARAPDAQISIVSQQTFGANHMADVFIQRANGPSETVSILATATGQYTLNMASSGSTYIPWLSWSLHFSGPGAGTGNPPGGGGGWPQVPLGSHTPQAFGSLATGERNDSSPENWGAILGIIGICVAHEALIHALAEYDCRNTGIRSLTYLTCGIHASVECHSPPPPPEPLPPAGGGGSNGGGGAAHGVTFVDFSFTTITGTVTVGEIQNE